MAGRKTGAAAKKQEDRDWLKWAIQNGKYPHFLTGISENDKSGKVFTYGTQDINKAMLFTEAEARQIVKECHGRLVVPAPWWEQKDAKQEDSEA